MEKRPPLSHHGSNLLTRLRKKGAKLCVDTGGNYWTEPDGKSAGPVCSRELITKGYVHIHDLGLFSGSPQSWKAAR